MSVDECADVVARVDAGLILVVCTVSLTRN
jgi:hypothetical protein